MQIVSAYFALAPTFIQKQYDHKSVIENYAPDLLRAYKSYEDCAIASAQVDQQNYKRKKAAWDTKMCYCGNNLRLIKSYDFWGCSNYQNKLIEHISFPNNSASGPYLQPWDVRISSTWLVEIIKSCDLKGKIFAKELYQFYINKGLEDLRIKYGRNTSENTFNGLLKAKARSIEQEDFAHKYLLSKFSRVAVQQCIHYQIAGEKPAFCIPDFICGRQNDVVVVDAKLDYTNDEKMEKYVALVEFILTGKEDNRTVSGAHIMYEHNRDSLPMIKSQFPIYLIPPPHDIQY